MIYLIQYSKKVYLERNHVLNILNLECDYKHFGMAVELTHTEIFDLHSDWKQCLWAHIGMAVMWDLIDVLCMKGYREHMAQKNITLQNTCDIT